MSVEASPQGVLGRLYDGILFKVEQVIVATFLIAVLGLSTAELLVRNLGLELFDVVPAQLATYYAAFHLGLYAAALACRGAQHIAIDAVGPFLPMKLKHALRAVLFLVACGTCVALMVIGWRYVFEHTSAEARVLPDRAGTLWTERVWKAPLVPAFALMSLHFLVVAIREAKAVPGAPMRREDPTLEATGGHP